MVGMPVNVVNEKRSALADFTPTALLDRISGPRGSSCEIGWPLTKELCHLRFSCGNFGD